MVEYGAKLLEVRCAATPRLLARPATRPPSLHAAKAIEICKRYCWYDLRAVCLVLAIVDDGVSVVRDEDVDVDDESRVLGLWMKEGWWSWAGAEYL
jgi:hypothetical protein